MRPATQHSPRSQIVYNRAIDMWIMTMNGQGCLVSRDDLAESVRTALRLERSKVREHM